MANLQTFGVERAIDWLKAHIKRNFDRDVSRAYNDQLLERWILYDRDDEIITILDERTIDDILLTLERLDWEIDPPAVLLLDEDENDRTGDEEP